VTWDEIRRAHSGQWVIIEYGRLDDELEVVDGEVIAAAPTRDEIYRRLMQDGRGRNVAIRYCGELPPDFAVMFCLDCSV
jgi:hypothetical protein